MVCDPYKCMTKAVIQLKGIKGLECNERPILIMSSGLVTTGIPYYGALSKNSLVLEQTVTSSHQLHIGPSCPTRNLIIMR